ncbi:acyl-CoA dehydrogenase family protein [Pseudomonas sp. NPDC007930]|uniref:acyl-CoA dehydrogenase family protein n=1 Tax=Pseudomonas sp. NPDC007930 TaxID=3364417 RepID=UPI0036ED8D09
MPAPPSFDQLHAAARALSQRFAAGASQRDRERQLPHAEVQALAEHGLLAARVPAAFGGAGLSVLQLVQLLVLIAQGDPNIAQAVQPHACGVEKLRIHASPAQQQHYLGLIGAGGMITNASAERGGAVVGQISTALARHGDAWQLNGTKHYATGSLFAQHFYVLANTAQGRALALVPVNRSGVQVVDDWNGMGQRTTASSTVSFTAVAVADSEILHLPHWNSRRTYEGAFAQVLHAAIDVGIALAALEDAVAFGRGPARPVPEAKTDRAGGDPYVQQAVGEMAIQAHAAEALLERAAGILDRAVVLFEAGAEADQALAKASIAVAEAKVAANDASLRNSEALFRVGGASATLQTRNLDRHWRNARTHTTHDPAAWKTQLVGDYLLNDQLPPISTKV